MSTPLLLRLPARPHRDQLPLAITPARAVNPSLPRHSTRRHATPTSRVPSVHSTHQMRDAHAARQLSAGNVCPHATSTTTQEVSAAGCYTGVCQQQHSRAITAADRVAGGHWRSPRSAELMQFDGHLPSSGRHHCKYLATPVRHTGGASAEVGLTCKALPIAVSSTAVSANACGRVSSSCSTDARAASSVT